MTVLRNGDGIVSVYNADGSAIEGDPVDRFGNPIQEGMCAVKNGYIKDHSVIYIQTSNEGEGSHANGKFYYVCDTGGGLVDGQVDVYVDGNQSTINAAPYGRTDNATISLVEENVTWEDYVSRYRNSTISDDGNVSSDSTNSNNSNKLSNNKSTLNLVLAVYQEVDGKMTISKQKINYQIETSKFATPAEFLVSNLQVTNDINYIKSISDMVVNNSTINYVIQDQYTETTVKEYESYTRNTYNVETNENGNVTSRNLKSSKDVGPNVLSKKVTKTLSIVSYIRSADTWIVKTQQRYVKKVEGPTSTISNEQDLGSGNYNSSDNTQIVNRKKWTETTIYSVKYVSAINVCSSSNSNSSGNTNIILGDNEIANKIITEAHNQLRVPYVWGGTSTSGFDCSGLVLWCCQKAGANIPPRVTSDYPTSASQYQVAWDDMKPGDVLQNDHHVGIYIGDGKFIHAPKTGDVVKISSVSGYGKFTAVYRFW